MFKKIISIGISIVLALGIVLPATLSMSAAESNANSVPEPSAVADAALEAAKSKQHPYMMYESDEIASLREKINSGNSKKAFDVIAETVPSCMKRTFNVAQGANGVIGRQLQYCVMYLSTYSMLTGDDSYAKKAVEQVVTCAEQGNVGTYELINGALCIGDFGTAYALAYDALYNYMSENERLLVKSEMNEIGAWIYENSPAVNTWGSEDENRKAWNWNAVTHGALGLISLSTGEHPEWLTLSVKRAQDYYQYSVDSTGAGMEGLHYIGYALNSLAPMDHAIYRLTGTELLDPFTAFQNMTYWSQLYMTVPSGKGQVAINQGDGLSNYSGPFYIINRYRQADALWAWEHTQKLDNGGKFSIEYHGNGWSAPAVIFFEDQTLTPVKPTAESNPLIVSYDKGLVVARDSWEKDASMFTFTCGRGYGGCWNHPDDGSFTFHARGESFIIDLGANFKESSEHNVVLINGKGMDYSGGPTMKEGKILEQRILENGNLYVSGSNITSYQKQNLLASTRQIVYGGGDVPFVLVFDYVRNNVSSNTFNINFFTKNGISAIVRNDSYAILTTESGQDCYVIPYSPDDVTVKSSTVGTSACITTETTGRFLRQATLFIMADVDGEMPDVYFSDKGKETTVTISRTVNGQEETETYVFSLESLADFTTTEELDTEEESSSTTENTEIVTETVPEVESSEETITDTENNSGNSGNAGSSDSGCASAIGTAAAIPVAAGATALILFKKKKRK